jgi:hypothetical protein
VIVPFARGRLGILETAAAPTILPEKYIRLLANISINSHNEAITIPVSQFKGEQNFVARNGVSALIILTLVLKENSQMKL